MLSPVRSTCVDFVFDGIRVAWLVVIGCIIFRPNHPISHTFALGEWLLLLMGQRAGHKGYPNVYPICPAIAFLISCTHAILFVGMHIIHQISLWTCTSYTKSFCGRAHHTQNLLQHFRLAHLFRNLNTKAAMETHLCLCLTNV